MLALAAVLWFVYLVPTWMRRREYLATERNATRLQQTLRVMAETAELPDEVRVEATAREAAQREQLLRQEQRRADALARAEVTAAAARARAAEARAAEIERAARAVTVTADRVVEQRPVAPAASASAREGLRRARRLAGLLLLASLVVAAVQLWLMVSTGAVLGSWLVLAACAAGAGVSLSLQRRIVARARTLAPAAARPVARRSASGLMDAEPVVTPVREWTPVPVPKPLYLEHQQRLACRWPPRPQLRSCCAPPPWRRSEPSPPPTRSPRSCRSPHVPPLRRPRRSPAVTPRWASSTPGRGSCPTSTRCCAAAVWADPTRSEGPSPR